MRTISSPPKKSLQTRAESPPPFRTAAFFILVLLLSGSACRSGPPSESQAERDHSAQGSPESSRTLSSDTPETPNRNDAEPPEPGPPERELVPIVVDEYLSEFVFVETPNPEYLVWRGVDSVILGINESPEVAQIEIGDPDWQAWTLELEVFVASDQLVRLGTSCPAENRHEVTFQRFETEGVDWVNLRIETDAEESHVLERVDEEWQKRLVIDKKHPAGGAAFLILPGENIALRRIFHRVESKVWIPGWSDKVYGKPGDEPNADGTPTSTPSSSHDGRDNPK